MKDAYFNHFTSYRKDSRVRRLLYEFGCTGYGVLWICIEKISQSDFNKCSFEELEADHIKPFSKGGPDELINLVTSCRRCNRQKKDKSYKEFMAWKIEHLIK